MPSLSLAIVLAVTLRVLDWRVEGAIVPVRLTRGQGISSSQVTTHGSCRFVTLTAERDDRVRVPGIPSPARGALMASYRTSGSPASPSEHRGSSPF